MLSGFYYPIWLAWKDEISPIIEAVAKSYGYAGYDTCRIMLAKLMARRVIAPHRDVGRSFELTHRIHVPILSSPDVVFTVGDENCYLAPGHAYEINNLRRHGVVNDWQHDRVHLIFDLYTASPSNITAEGR